MEAGSEDAGYRVGEATGLSSRRQPTSRHGFLTSANCSTRVLPGRPGATRPTGF